MPAAPDVRGGTDATVVIRPESIRVGVGEQRATVRRATFLGPMAEYELSAGPAELLAVDADWMGQGLHDVGDEVSWSLRAEQAYALPPSADDVPAAEDPEAD